MIDLVLKNGDRYLFMGDSITDCGRRDDPRHMGSGYAALVPGLIAAEHPELQLEFSNRGIGGDTLRGLEARWDEDALALRPTWMSMLIGINDLHCYMNGDEDLGPEQYAARYEKLLAATRVASGCQLILRERFFYTVPPGADEHQQKVMELIPQYIAIVHELAEKFSARLIRTHEWGQEIISHHGTEILCNEPVHPHLTGHAVLAQWVLKALKA